MGWRLVVLSLVVFGCVEHQLVPCGEQWCPTTAVCTAGGCASPAAAAACDGATDADPCTVDSVPGFCLGGACFGARCGDAVVNPGELCDDGNQVFGDGCSGDCRSLEVCANGIVDPLLGEYCDDGNRLSGDGCASGCSLEFQTWRDVSTSTPLAREGHAMAVGPNGRLVMFGGEATGLGVNLADTWEWDGATWLDRRLGVAPSLRSLHAMAYDPSRKRVVLFGGSGFGDPFKGDTWEWDGLRWEERTPALSPAGRNSTAMAFDVARGKVVLVGGFGVGSARLADTWEWDGTTWTMTSDAPAVRAEHAMAYLPGTGLVVVGGTPPGSPVWVRDGNGGWTAPVVTGASGLRMSPAFAHDPARGTVLLVGGRGFGPCLSDVWEWDGVAAAWSVVSPNGASTPCRVQPAMALDPTRNQLLYYGGAIADVGTRSEAKYWTGATSTWTDVAPIQTPPSGTNAVVFDPRRGVDVYYNGEETWEWDGQAWARRVSPTSPPPRISPTLAYDEKHGVVVMFGGRDRVSGTTPLADHWEWNGAMWQLRTPATRPSPRFEHAMAYDRVRERIVLFGGYLGTMYSPETWEWDGTSWLQRMPATSPPARANHAMAYDAARSLTMLFGGNAGSLGTVADTWLWDGTDWRSVPEATGVKIRASHALAYDPRRRTIVLFGGRRGIEYYKDVFAWTGTTWVEQELVAAGAARAEMSLAVDRFGGLITFGGRSVNATPTASTHRLGFESAATELEICADAAVDLDADGLAGCDDPDCWQRCTPLCPPGLSCDPLAARCGNATCEPVEDRLICPADCPP